MKNQNNDSCRVNNFLCRRKILTFFRTEGNPHFLKEIVNKNITMNVDLAHEIFKVEQFFLELEQKGKLLSKSSNLSKQAREAGNQLYTKKNHDQSIHRNILLQYTKSIAFAPKDSKELSLGYSNRSVLLMHLCHYEKCMFDIHKALENTKCDQLKSKLESRREKCMMLMNNQKTKRLNDQKCDEINISRRSKQIPSAAESVSLRYNETYGRQLIANQDIKVGEIVVAEKGYACYPLYNQIHLVCSHCLTFAWNGIPCDFCPFAIYCNESCKNEAWNEYHSIECPLLKFLHYDENIFRKEVMLANRILIKAVKSEGFYNVMSETELVHDGPGTSALLTNGVLNSNKFRSCYNLHCAFPNGRQGKFSYEVMIAYLLLKYTSIISSQSKEHIYDVNDEKILMQLKNVFVKLKNIVLACSFHYQLGKCDCVRLDECQEEYVLSRGILIGSCSSLMNHSCMNNVGRFFVQQRKIVFYASSPIKKGEQLCCNYGPFVTMNHTERKKLISEKFLFTCACTACIDNKTIAVDVPLEELFQEVNKEILWKIFCDFQIKYKDLSINLYFQNLSDNIFSKELLEQSFTLTELVHKHLDSYTAFQFSFSQTVYILRAFNKLFGEKCLMPDSC